MILLSYQPCLWLRYTSQSQTTVLHWFGEVAVTRVMASNTNSRVDSDFGWVLPMDQSLCLLQSFSKRSQSMPWFLYNAIHWKEVRNTRQKGFEQCFWICPEDAVQSHVLEITGLLAFQPWETFWLLRAPFTDLCMWLMVCTSRGCRNLSRKLASNRQAMAVLSTATWLDHYKECCLLIVPNTTACHNNEI